MQAPQGFKLDPQSGLYYSEKIITDAQSGSSARQITWFNAQDGTFHPVTYPLEEKAAEQSEPAAAPQKTEPVIPEGFIPYAGTNLYCQSKMGFDPQTGAPAQIVTYFNPETGETQQTVYSVPQPQAESPAEVKSEPLPKAKADIPVPSVHQYNEPRPFDAGGAEPEPEKSAEALLPPPPEPELKPNIIPRSYLNTSAQFVSSPVQAATVRQGGYKAKKSRLPLIIICIAAAFLIIVAVGICAWQFKWYTLLPFWNDGKPEANMSGIAQSSEAVSESSGSSDISGSDASVSPKFSDLSVLVLPFPSGQAKIILDGITLEKAYPASISGVPEGALLYEWGLTFGEYKLSVSYFCRDAGDTGTISPAGMRCSLWKRNGDGYSAVGDSVPCSASKGQLIFGPFGLPEGETLNLKTFADYNFVYQYGERHESFKPVTLVKNGSSAASSSEKAGAEESSGTADISIPFDNYYGRYTCKDGGFQGEYLPALDLKEDGTFTMAVNTGFGMAKASGRHFWAPDEEVVYLYVDKMTGSGFLGDDAKEVKLEVSDTALVLRSPQLGLMIPEQSFTHD